MEHPVETVQQIASARRMPRVLPMRAGSPRPHRLRNVAFERGLLHPTCLHPLRPVRIDPYDHAANVRRIDDAERAPCWCQRKAA